MGNLRLISDGPLVNRPDDLKRVNQKLRDVGNEVGRYGKLAAQGVSQLAFGDEGTIPWWMSFAPGADLTDKVMEGRRPGLLDIPGPGTLGKFAMVPIMKFGSKEILEGGARMGKSAKNIAKTRESRDFVHRVHRTRKENERSIDKHGLLIGSKNKNFGKNTGDTSEYPASVWFGVDPVNVPVLQYYFTHGPDTRKQLTTYNVRIPRNVYNNTPRVKFEGGRGGKPVIVGKGKSSLTHETARRTGNDTVIDVFSGNVPPEWLSKIPPEDFEKMVQKGENREKLRDLFNKFYGDMDYELTVHDLSKFDELMDRRPSLEQAIKPWTFGGTRNAESALEDFQVMFPSGSKYRPAPTVKLRDILDENKVYLASPLSDGGLSWNGTLRDIVKDAEKASYYTQPLGSVSRGHLYDEMYGTTRFPTVKERNYNWTAYRKNIENGESPAVAHYQSLPEYQVDWGMFDEDAPRAYARDFGSLKGLGDLDGKHIQYGAISRPMSEQNTKSTGTRLMNLAQMTKPEDLRFGPTLNARFKLRDLIDKSDNPSPYVEKIMTSNGTLGNLKEAAGGLEFQTNVGSVYRGMDDTFEKKPLKQLFDEYLAQEMEDSAWQIDIDNPEEVAELYKVARERAKEHLRDYMRDATDNPFIAKIGKLKDLIDAKTPGKH